MSEEKFRLEVPSCGLTEQRTVVDDKGTHMEYRTTTYYKDGRIEQTEWFRTGTIIYNTFDEEKTNALIPAVVVAGFIGMVGLMVYLSLTLGAA